MSKPFSGGPLHAHEHDHVSPRPSLPRPGVQMKPMCRGVTHLSLHKIQNLFRSIHRRSLVYTFESDSWDGAMRDVATYIRNGVSANVHSLVGKWFSCLFVIIATEEMDFIFSEEKKLIFIKKYAMVESIVESLREHIG